MIPTIRGDLVKDSIRETSLNLQRKRDIRTSTKRGVRNCIPNSIFNNI